MKLEFEHRDGSRLIDHPSAADIGRIFNGPGPSGFVILEREKDMFIQVAPAGGGKYVFEYKEGSMGQFRSVQDISLQEAGDVFSQYLTSDDSWKKRYAWSVLEIQKPNLWPLIGIFMAIGFILFLIYHQGK